MDHKATLTTPDKTQIVGILSKAKKDNDKIIVLCHGLTVDKDEDGIFRQLSENLVENGFDCFRFDFRGHGESGGKQEEMTIAGELTDLLTVVNFIKNKNYKKIGLLGASFGGGICALFSSFNKDAILALVLWNPVLDYSSWLFPKNNWHKKYFGQTAIERAEKFGFTEVGSRKFKLGIKLFNEIRFLKPYQELKKYKKPILFVHGDKDSYVDYQESIRFSKLLKAKLITIKDAEHGFQDKREWQEKAINKTISFFKKFIQ